MTFRFPTSQSRARWTWTEGSALKAPAKLQPRQSAYPWSMGEPHTSAPWAHHLPSASTPSGSTPLGPTRQSSNGHDH